MTTMESKIVDTMYADGGSKMTVARRDASEDDWKDADFLCLKGIDEKEGIKDEVNDEAQDRSFSVDQEFVWPQESYLSADESHWPPWKNLSGMNPRDGREPPALVRLHNEMVDFVSLMEPRPDEIEERDQLVKQVTQIIHDAFGGPDKVRWRTWQYEVFLRDKVLV